MMSLAGPQRSRVTSTWTLTFSGNTDDGLIVNGFRGPYLFSDRH
jgi:hypothetical protein